MFTFAAMLWESLTERWSILREILSTLLISTQIRVTRTSYISQNSSVRSGLLHDVSHIEPSGINLDHIFLLRQHHHADASLAIWSCFSLKPKWCACVGVSETIFSHILIQLCSIYKTKRFVWMCKKRKRTNGKSSMATGEHDEAEETAKQHRSAKDK